VENKWALRGNLQTHARLLAQASVAHQMKEDGHP